MENTIESILEATGTKEINLYFLINKDFDKKNLSCRSR
jgi:hypothetical protein